jgi:hypothetical protein
LVASWVGWRNLCEFERFACWVILIGGFGMFRTLIEGYTWIQNCFCTRIDHCWVQMSPRTTAECNGLHLLCSRALKKPIRQWTML